METVLLIALGLGFLTNLSIMFMLYASIRRQEILLDSIEINTSAKAQGKEMGEAWKTLS